MPRLNTTLIRGVALTSAKKQTNKPNGKSKDKQCMIYGAGHNSEECKFLSYFGNKWSTTRPYKYPKLGNTNTLQEANAIVSKIVEAVIHDEKKVNKQKVKNVKRKHFVILRLWIQTLKLNYILLEVLTCQIQEKNQTNEDYTQYGAWGTLQ